jgi:hypothetical protein
VALRGFAASLTLGYAVGRLQRPTKAAQTEQEMGDASSPHRCNVSSARFCPLCLIIANINCHKRRTILLRHLRALARGRANLFANFRFHLNV